MSFGTSTYAKLAASSIGNKVWPLPCSPFGQKVIEVLDAAYKEAMEEAMAAINPKPAPIPRKRNELLDALIELCGGVPAMTTKSEFRTAATALAEIKTVCPALTIDELQARVQRYKEKNRDWALTPPALAKWWSHLGGGPRTQSEKADIYIQPPGWRTTLQRMYDLSNEAIRDKEWLDLGPDTRREILKKMNA